MGRMSFFTQGWNNLEECLQDLTFLSLEGCCKVKSAIKVFCWLCCCTET